jgi:hypothetical protein
MTAYRERAEMHKPKTPEEIQRTAQDLAAQGFGDYTIAHVLAMDVNAVRQMIGECQSCE